MATATQQKVEALLAAASAGSAPASRHASAAGSRAASPRAANQAEAGSPLGLEMRGLGGGGSSGGSSAAEEAAAEAAAHWQEVAEQLQGRLSNLERLLPLAHRWAPCAARRVAWCALCLRAKQPGARGRAHGRPPYIQPLAALRVLPMQLPPPPPPLRHVCRFNESLQQVLSELTQLGRRNSKGGNPAGQAAQAALTRLASEQQQLRCGKPA